MHNTKSSFFHAIEKVTIHKIDKIYNQYYNYVYGTASTKYRKTKQVYKKKSKYKRV